MLDTMWQTNQLNLNLNADKINVQTSFP